MSHKFYVGPPPIPSARETAERWRRKKKHERMTSKYEKLKEEEEERDWKGKKKVKDHR